jgi:hypothetical protein
MEFEQDRERDEKCRIRSTNLRSTYRCRNVCIATSHIRTTQAHREVILRFERLSEVEISDTIPDLLQTTPKRYPKGSKRPCKRILSIFGLRVGFRYSWTPDQRVKDPYTPRSDGKRFAGYGSVIDAIKQETLRRLQDTQSIPMSAT